MVFNSIPFLIFFVIVFFIYYTICKDKKQWQNWLLLLASYFFLGYANWKMLWLFIVATVVFYYLGIAIGKANEKNQERLKVLGVVLGLGLLLYFKYLGFFIDSIASLLNAIGLHTNIHSFKIIMPLGISFFTFRLISYVLEVYDENIEPERDFVSFATYISFFPCILSGPIDRPQFMHQLKAVRTFEYKNVADGCRQFLWGLFKKVVVADNCAIYVDAAWGNIDGSSASTLVMAAILYSFELYADFSGYSDMAIGVGKWLGLKITDNFKTPFFALNIADFWRRWHISLTKWMTDYVYTPLSFVMRDWKKWGTIMAIIVNFILVGFWHGANWIYGVYGLYHGLLFVPLILSGAFAQKNEIRVNRWNLPKWIDFSKMLLTFVLVTVSFLLFRSEDLSLFGHYIVRMCNDSILTIPYLMKRQFYIPTIIAILVMGIVEWVYRNDLEALLRHSKYRCIRWLWYYMLIIACFYFSAKESAQFIYFQF
ncbi:MAG: MBOAT family protein [Prevotellaceae bacterium]|nr:MBOAT family protein [Candidatus Faecinaster equi]